MYRCRSRSLVAFGVCLIAAVRANAQPLFPHAQSIECTVANADLVFVAKIEKVGNAEKADGREVHQVTIAVEETLKQDLFTIDPYTRVSIDVPGSAAVLADWAKRACPLLVAHDNDAPKATRVIELTEGKLVAWTADLTLLRKPDAVIRAARDMVRRTPAGVRRIHTFGLKVPRELVGGTVWEMFYGSGGHLVLSVPADGRLE
jgi:hypothetical protein